MNVVCYTCITGRYDKLKQPVSTNAITIEDLKKHLISLYRVQVAELFVKEEK